MPATTEAGAWANFAGAYTGIAVYDGHQWASICPELDIASVGSSADEAMNNLVQAVAEAIQFAAEEGLEPGRPVPDGELRALIVSSQAPYYVRKFYA